MEVTDLQCHLGPRVQFHVGTGMAPFVAIRKKKKKKGRVPPPSTQRVTTLPAKISIEDTVDKWQGGLEVDNSDDEQRYG